MKNNRLRQLTALCCDIAAFALAFYSILRFFDLGGQANMQGGGFDCFRYFTVDSNALAALSCLALIPSQLRALRRSEAEIPHQLLLFKYVGTSAVTVTLLTVLLFLGPTQGYPAMFAGAGLHLHLTCPLLCILSLLLLEKSAPINRRQRLLGLLPTAIYELVYLYQVVIVKRWPDFYGFNRGGWWPVSVIAMLLATCGICLMLSRLHNHLLEK